MQVQITKTLQESLRGSVVSDFAGHAYQLRTVRTVQTQTPALPDPDPDPEPDRTRTRTGPGPTPNPPPYPGGPLCLAAGAGGAVRRVDADTRGGRRVHP